MREVAGLLGQGFGAGVRHHVDLPDEDLGHGLAGIAARLFNLLLDAVAVVEVNEDQRVDVALGEQLGGARAKGAVGARDEGGAAGVRLCGDDGAAEALALEVAPGEVLGEEERDAPEDEAGEAGEADEQPGEAHGDGW